MKYLTLGINNRQRRSKDQSRMYNPETKATFCSTSEAVNINWKNANPIGLF